MNISKPIFLVLLSCAVTGGIGFCSWSASQFLDIKERMTKLETKIEILVPHKVAQR